MCDLKLKKRHDIISKILLVLTITSILTLMVLVLITICTNNVYHICIREKLPMSQYERIDYIISIDDNHCKKCAAEITKTDFVMLKNNYCTNCHTEDLEGDFCKDCGTKIITEYAENIENTKYKSIDNYVKRNNTLNLMCISCFIMSVILVIIYVAHITYYLNKYHTDKDKNIDESKNISDDDFEDENDTNQTCEGE